MIIVHPNTPLIDAALIAYSIGGKLVTDGKQTIIQEGFRHVDRNFTVVSVSFRTAPKNDPEPPQAA